MATYKTKDGIDRILLGIGRTVNGLITTDQVIENSMFELVTEPAAPDPSPTAQPRPVATQPTQTNQETK